MSSAANTGSAAHLIGERCLRSGLDPEWYLGDVVTPTEEPHSVLGASGCKRWIHCPGSIAMAATGGSPRKGPEPVKVDQRMVNGVSVYVDYVREVAKGGVLHIEKTFDLAFLMPGMFGTADATVVNEEKKQAWVVDYKNGATEVHVEWNPQLLYYAIGALHGLPAGLVEEVTLVVVQPNCIGSEAIKEWTISMDELRAWAVEVLLPAATATTRKHAPRRPGEHCTFCPGQYNKRCHELSSYIHELKVAVLKPDTPVEKLTSTQKLELVENLDMLVGMAKRAKDCLQYEAEQGIFKHPDWKLVAGKSNRKWKPEAEGRLAQLLGDDAFNRKLKGIGDTEKILKDRGVDAKALMLELTEKPFAGYQLVKASDRRAAIAPVNSLELLT